MRLFAAALLLAAAPALAQSPEAEAHAAAEAALLAADAALADSLADVMPEVRAAMADAEAALPSAEGDTLSHRDPLRLMAAQSKNADGSFSNIDAETVAALESGGVLFIDPSVATTAGSPEASGDDGYDDLALYRRPARASVRAYPAVAALYGADGDGFPAQTTIEGTVVSAGALRLCRQGREPVSRWLRVRLAGTPPEMPAHIVVAVECDERDARHYVGRAVRMRAWKSAEGDPVRMAHDDVPASDAPLYVTYPGDLTVQ